MTQTKQVTLYHGRAPVTGDEKLQKIIVKETQFCAVFDSNPALAHDHNIATDVLFGEYGTDHSQRISPLLRPFLVDEAGVATFPDHLLGIGDGANLRETGYRIGGFFFDEAIAGFVIPGLGNLGYEVNKKYGELQRA